MLSPSLYFTVIGGQVFENGGAFVGVLLCRFQDVRLVLPTKCSNGYGSVEVLVWSNEI